jgi:hypothetical protein
LFCIFYRMTLQMPEMNSTGQSAPIRVSLTSSQSRTQSNACARARMALALGKLTTGTPKFRGSGSLSAYTIDKR